MSRFGFYSSFCLVKVQFLQNTSSTLSYSFISFYLRMVLLKIFFRRDKPSSAILAMAGKLWLAVLCARHTLACRLQNNDCFVPKPLRFKCLRILSLFCVICARRKNASAFSALLVVSTERWFKRTAHLPQARNPPSHKQKKQAFACFFWWEEVDSNHRSR